jgi:hypothetical protein
VRYHAAALTPPLHRASTPASRTPPSWATLRAPLVAFVVAFFTQALVVKHLAVDVPVDDEWCFTDTLENVAAHGITWADLAAQHNEHRIVTTRLALFATVAALGEWSPIAMMLVSALVAAGIAGLWAHVLGRLGASPSVVVLSMLLLLTPAQWENMTWGFQSQFYWAVFCALLGVWAVARSSTLDWGGLCVAIGSALVATFSLSSGACSWPVIAVALLARAFAGAESARALASDREVRVKAAAFLGAALVTAMLYSHRFQLTDFGHNRATSVSRSVAWLFILLGFPLTRILGESVRPASVLATLLVWAPVVLALVSSYRQRHRPLALARFTVLLGLLLYCVATVTALAVGRGGIPTTIAPSRYATLTVWGSLLCLLAIGQLASGLDRRRTSGRLARVGLYATGALIVAAHAYRAVDGVAEARRDRDLRVRYQAVVQRYYAAPAGARVLGDPAPYPARYKGWLEARLAVPLVADLLPRGLGSRRGTAASTHGWRLFQAFMDFLEWIAAGCALLLAAMEARAWKRR